VDLRICFISSTPLHCNRRTDRHRWTSTRRMGIFLVPVPSRRRQPKLSAEDRIWTVKQDGRPLDRYVEEFAELSSKVSWPDALLNSCFLRGLDEDTIRYFEPECLFSLVESINLILFLNGSEFEIEEVHKESYSPRPALSETQAAWPVHQPPNSSTYRSSGHSLIAQPDPNPQPPKRRSRRPRRGSSRLPRARSSTCRDRASLCRACSSLRRARSSLRRARTCLCRARYGPRRTLSGLQALASPYHRGVIFI